MRKSVISIVFSMTLMASAVASTHQRGSELIQPATNHDKTELRTYPHMIQVYQTVIDANLTNSALHDKDPHKIALLHGHIPLDQLRSACETDPNRGAEVVGLAALRASGNRPQIASGSNIGLCNTALLSAKVTSASISKSAIYYNLRITTDENFAHTYLGSESHSKWWGKITYYWTAVAPDDKVCKVPIDIPIELTLFCKAKQYE